ncbi:hypothetical protein LIER_23147 [Lithospermum erythrorhizon]|uniref:Retrotransposon gag domain-containing protein n=1 Tax=Lithospermum erythrorhizon TaxID=34254 RepID=A0AAV3QXQ3_LITER
MAKGFTIPKFRTCYVMGDPCNHLKAYDSQLSFWTSEDDVYARAFPNSLSGAAMKRLHKLPPNSIDCWQDTVHLFINKFRASIVIDKVEEALMNLKQKQLSHLTVKYIKESKRKISEARINKFGASIYGREAHQRGHLREFVKKDPERSPRQLKGLPRREDSQRSRSPPRITGWINTVLGGLVGGGDTSNSRKQYARRAIYRLAPMTTIDREVIKFWKEELA